MRLRVLWQIAVVLGVSSLFVAPRASAQTTIGDSALVLWSCTGSPCPWGTWTDGHALVWPAAQNPLSSRHGYTTSGGVYLPAEQANRATIWIDTGSATLYAGYPAGGSHRVLATVGGSNFFDVSGLADGEVLSVQSGSAFSYQIDMREAPVPEEPPSGGGPEVPPIGIHSPEVTWNCTGSSCPWGLSSDGFAVAWPTSAEPISTRLGYTTSQGVYLPATRANGTAIRIESGSATLYAGAPNASSHRVLTALNASGVYEVSGLVAGEVLSVQSSAEFVYEVSIAAPSVPQDPEPDPPPSGPGNPPPVPGSTSQLVTWTCTSTPCPWGSSLAGYAQAWAADAAINSRLGYTTSHNIYLPAHLANGMKLVLSNGGAALYAGAPGASAHRVVGHLSVGAEFEVEGLLGSEVLSLQSDGQFSVAITPSNGPPPPPANLVYSIPAYWRCDIADCVDEPWLGSVINWPSWAAYPNNNRDGWSSRTVYSETGALLTPYMGSWANGCEVTAYAGNVLIIEWERGTDIWRETYIEPGETHTIQLTAPEDGALIEVNGHFNDFAVQLNNCTPQPLP